MAAEEPDENARSRPPELPGFTWNETTGRYMRILPNHQARVLDGTAATMSEESVYEYMVNKRRRIEKEAKRHIPGPGIQRSIIRSHPIFGASLDQQIGLSSHSVDLAGKAWSSLLSCSYEPPIEGTYMLQQAEHSGALLGVGWAGKECTEVPGLRLSVVKDSEDGRPITRSFALPHGRITSMSAFDDGILLTTYERSLKNYYVQLSTLMSTDNSLIYYKDLDKTSQVHDFWCADLHPNRSRPQIAVGTECGILIQNPFCSHGHNYKCINWAESVSPVYSIRWKSEHVVAAGSRDETARLCDVRVGESVVRLRHGSAVMRLICADEHRILLGGPKGLALYDLRYCKTPHHRRQSRPWIQYKGYDSKGVITQKSDIDISPRLGLLAVATDSAVGIYNLWTGEENRDITPPPSSHPRGYIYKDPNVKFLRQDHPSHFFQEENDPIGIVVTRGEKIARWML